MPQPAPSAAHDRFASFAEFYPFYLGEHRDRTCRRLHFIGTLIVLTLTLVAFTLAEWRLLLALPIAGYGFAWVGHFVFEKNRPATFSHPWYSLIGDFALFRDILSGRIKF
jgi:hypothetical protein